MSVNMFDWTKAYFQSENPDLVETRATMATLASYANFTDMTCFPSQRTLARLLDCSTETIRRHIKKNIEAGWIEKIRDGKSYSVTNKYRFTIPTPHTREGSVGTRPDKLPSHTRGVTRSPQSELPTPTRGVSHSPHTRGVTPLIHEGRTPLTSVGLTIKTNYSENHSESGSRGEPSDPFKGSGAITSPADPTTEDTPLTHEGSSAHTSEGSLSTGRSDKPHSPWNRQSARAIRWPKDKPLPPGFDPFATYVDEETGEPFDPFDPFERSKW